MKTKCIIFLSSLAIFCGFCSTCFADVATCGPTFQCKSIYPTGFDPAECEAYCQYSDVCQYGSFNNQLFGGFWAESFLDDPEFLVYNYKVIDGVGDQRYPVGATVLQYCTDYCNEEMKNCQDDACRAKFAPQDIDCSSISNEQDRMACENGCHNNILTSACGRSCLVQGIDDDDVVNRGCQYLCQSFYDCNSEESCTSLPLKQKKDWSILTLLIAVLTIVTTGLIFRMGRKSDKNSTL